MTTTAVASPASPADLVGRTVQYRKVGTFLVTALVDPWVSDLSPEFLAANPNRARFGGWYTVEAIKAPKAYRSGNLANNRFFLHDTDVIA